MRRNANISKLFCKQMAKETGYCDSSVEKDTNDKNWDSPHKRSGADSARTKKPSRWFCPLNNWLTKHFTNKNMTVWIETMPKHSLNSSRKRYNWWQMFKRIIQNTSTTRTKRGGPKTFKSRSNRNIARNHWRYKRRLWT